ncbi:MAG: AAA family ATPase [Acidobacteriota bacterium]|nr:AAA family ATPase [Acidobacteriota bacterium]
MKIKQLDVAGFRSLKSVSWKPGDLNVVIGPNGAGKSNLLQALEMISASAQGKLSDFILAASGINSLLWDGQARNISFHLIWNPDRTLPNSKDYAEDNYDLLLAASPSFDYYQINLEKWARDEIDDVTGLPITNTWIDRKDGNFFYKGKEIDGTETSPQETILSLFNSFPSDGFFKRGDNLYRRRLAELGIYHDWDVSQNAKIRQATVTRRESRVASDGQNLISVLHTLYTSDREFERSLDAALHAAFGQDYEKLVFPPAADQRIQLRLRWRTLRREVSAADLSDGTLRFLLLLTVLIAPNPPMLIAIDEPETGLHPSMLPIIAEFAVEASSRTQVIFTTHSPQFLSAFGKHRPTTTVAEWKNGETLLHTLDGKQLDYWLEDYSLGALFESGQLEAMT